MRDLDKFFDHLNELARQSDLPLDADRPGSVMNGILKNKKEEQMIKNQATREEVKGILWRLSDATLELECLGYKVVNFKMKNHTRIITVRDLFTKENTTLKLS